MSLTYNGSTAGSTLANPPVLLAASIAGHVQYASSGSTAAIGKLPVGASGAKLWFYASTNLYTDVQAVATFNDGYALGFSPGDVLLGVFSSADSTTPYCYLGVLVSSAGSTSFTLSSNVISSTMVTSG